MSPEYVWESLSKSRCGKAKSWFFVVQFRRIVELYRSNNVSIVLRRNQATGTSAEDGPKRADDGGWKVPKGADGGGTTLNSPLYTKTMSMRSREWNLVADALWMELHADFRLINGVIRGDKFYEAHTELTRAMIITATVWHRNNQDPILNFQVVMWSYKLFNSSYYTISKSQWTHGYEVRLYINLIKFMSLLPIFWLNNVSYRISNKKDE